MATAKASSAITGLDVTITLKLSGAEAAALNEMTGYGIDAFLKGYYKYLGSHYMKPFEPGLRSLFQTIKKSLPYELRKLQAYQDALVEASKQISADDFAELIPTRRVSRLRALVRRLVK